VFAIVVLIRTERPATQNAELHAAATELFEDAVVGHGATDQRLRIRHLAHILGCGRRQVNEGGQLEGQVLINVLTGDVKRNFKPPVIRLTKS
jgi:DNA-binding GntR family transcriptional regulator